MAPNQCLVSNYLPPSLIDIILFFEGSFICVLKFFFSGWRVKHTLITNIPNRISSGLGKKRSLLKFDAYPCALKESASGFPYLPSNYFACFLKDRIFFLNIKDLRYVLSNLRHNILNPLHPDLPLKIQDKLSNPTNL